MPAVRRSWDAGGADREFNTQENWNGDTNPVTGDDAMFPPMANSYSPDVAGGDMTAILLVNTLVQAGCLLGFGQRDDYLMLDTDYLRFEGEGQAFLDIDNSTEVLVLAGRSTDGNGDRGMSLVGSGNALLVVDAGEDNSVGVGANAGESAAFTAIRVMSGDVEVGDTVTYTTLVVRGGNVRTNCGVQAGGTVTVSDGGVLTIEQGSPITLTIEDGGRVIYNEPDLTNVTIIVQAGGQLELGGDVRPKIFSTTVIQRYPGGQINDPFGLLADQALTLKESGTIAG